MRAARLNNNVCSTQLVGLYRCCVGVLAALATKRCAVASAPCNAASRASFRSVAPTINAEHPKEASKALDHPWTKVHQQPLSAVFEGVESDGTTRLGLRLPSVFTIR